MLLARRWRAEGHPPCRGKQLYSGPGHLEAKRKGRQIQLQTAPPSSKCLLAENAMSFCEEWTLVKRSPEGVSATPLRCRCWTCSECGPRRKAQLIAKAFAGKPTNFLTLTCSTTHFPDPEAGARALSDAWRLIVKRAKREAKRNIAKTPSPLGAEAEWADEEDGQGRVKRQVTLTNEKLPYLAVFEATKNGWPHLHIIARVPWMSQKWLSAQMGEIMSSPVCWIKRVADDGRIVHYISKYVGKESEKFGSCKRYWCTTNWEQPDGDAADDAEDEYTSYEVEMLSLDFVVSEWIAEGYECVFKRGTWYRGVHHRRPWRPLFADPTRYEEASRKSA